MSDYNWKFVKLILSWQSLFTVIITNCLLVLNLVTETAIAQKTQDCQLSSKATEEKERFRLLAIGGNKEAETRYQTLLKQHTQELQNCRRQNWPQNQAIWLRLYPCDIQPGAVDQVMDRIVNQGYNQVYLEVFYDGRVLLPAADNPTVWPAVVRTPGAEKVDLLALAIKKGQERGLKVYAWMFTNNFGYTYAQRADRKDAIARNGKNQTSLSVVEDSSQVFIDPYNTQAKTDFYRMVQQVVRRRPDGILFDYVRYPRQSGTDSIATKVHDLWLFTPATQQVLFRRAKNSKGLELIRRFLTKGYVSAGDIAEVDKRYPQEGEPMWEGRIPPQGQKSLLSPQENQQILQSDLWLFTVAHAMQGILDFVALASYPATQKGIPAGVVFFPEGNQALGQGYDSRLQPWDKFPSSLEWHPMSYANCGNANCIVQQVREVLKTAQPGTQIIPALAGKWGDSISNRPSLEAQMQALRQLSPQIKGVSHFAYSWQYPDHDTERKSCKVR
jgi:hypothetical protein